jgi:hypothetical protein
MRPHRSIPLRTLACFNWKCALMSAAVRSLVYLIAMARVGAHGRLAVVAIEMFYVTLTAGTYAGIQRLSTVLTRETQGKTS